MTTNIDYYKRDRSDYAYRSGCGHNQHHWVNVPRNPTPIAPGIFVIKMCRECDARIFNDRDGDYLWYPPKGASVRGVSETPPRISGISDAQRAENRRAENERRKAAYSASPDPDPDPYLTVNTDVDWRRNAPKPETVMRKITSTEALQFILDEIKNSPDPFTAAGTWLTLFTNGVAEITREEQ